MTTDRFPSLIEGVDVASRSQRRGRSQRLFDSRVSKFDASRHTQPDEPTLSMNCYFPRSISLEGVGTFVSGVARGMTKSGWQVRLLSPGGTAPQEGIEERTYQSGSLGLMRYAAGFREASQDAAAVFEIENNPNMGCLSRFSQCPRRTFCYFTSPLQSLATLAEMGWNPQSFAHSFTKHHWFGRLQNWTQRRCVVATQFQAAQLRKLGAAEVHVLRGGGLSKHVEVPSRQEARRELGWDDRPVVGYLGHYSPAKGVPVLFDAFRRCTGPTVLALAYSGKGRLPRAAEAQLAGLRQAGRLRELGVVDPVCFLAACDVVVLPFVTSSIHHLPLVMLESFAARTPVIVSQVGGVAEIITPGMHGDVVPPRDPQALANTLQRHLADQDACHTMGHHARRLFENELANEVFCTRLSDIIRQEPRHARF